MSNHPESRSRSRQNLADLFCEFSQSPDESSSTITDIAVGNIHTHKWRTPRIILRCGWANTNSQGRQSHFWSENRPEWVAAFWGCVLPVSSLYQSTTARHRDSCATFKRSSMLASS